MNVLTTPNGNAARVDPGLEPPKGQAKYFGWTVDEMYPNTVEVDQIAAMWANPKGGYTILLKVPGITMIVPDADALRLMRIMGWKETSAIHQA